MNITWEDRARKSTLEINGCPRTYWAVVKPWRNPETGLLGYGWMVTYRPSRKCHGWASDRQEAKERAESEIRFRLSCDGVMEAEK